jgi:hypothetical protein
MQPKQHCVSSPAAAAAAIPAGAVVGGGAEAAAAAPVLAVAHSRGGARTCSWRNCVHVSLCTCSPS